MGKVKSINGYRKTKLVHSYGINDLNERIKIDGKHLESYKVWIGMLQRCYSVKCQERHQSYIGCSVSDEWIYFSNFKRWFDENYIEGYALDKDILVPGNKIYSKYTCTFVPQYLNNLLTDSARSRTDMPIGVRIQKIRPDNRRLSETYQAQCSDGYKKKITKSFKTLEDAVKWYSETKKQVVRNQIERAKADGFNNEAVFQALLAREF